MMLGRRLAGIGLAFALGCATSPSRPVVLSPHDLDAAREILQRELAGNYQVSEVEVAERVVTLDLVAITSGDGWQRVERASCRRCADDAPWECSSPQSSTHVDLGGPKAFVGGGLSGDEAVEAIRFIRERTAVDPTLENVTEISCVAAVLDREIYVKYGATIHHAGSASGLLVLERKGGTFEVESIQRPPNWFEGGRLESPECDTTQLFSLPSC